ncbi:SCO7460 family lipoprotein [Streptomyces sp. NPDC002454]
MRWRRGYGAAAVALAVLVSGCVASTGEDRDRARETAEEVYPGELTVVGARSLFPAFEGSEVTFAVRDDPDAAVVLRVDAEGDRCDGGACGPALRAARERAEASARAWRALEREFSRCGHEVLGVKASGGTVTEPWIAARLDDGNVTAVLRRIGGCLEAYGRAVPPPRTAPGTSAGAVVVHVVDPSVVDGLPEPAAEAPTLVGRTSTERHAALARRAYRAVLYRWTREGIEPQPVSARLVMPFEEKQAFEEEVHANVRAWLRPYRPHAVLSAYGGIWKLAEGRVDRLEGVVKYCDEPRGERPACVGDHVLHVTVDRAGRLVGDPVGTRAPGGPADPGQSPG